MEAHLLQFFPNLLNGVHFRSIRRNELVSDFEQNYQNQRSVLSFFLDIPCFSRSHWSGVIIETFQICVVKKGDWSPYIDQSLSFLLLWFASYWAGDINPKNECTHDSFVCFRKAFYYHTITTGKDKIHKNSIPARDELRMQQRFVLKKNSGTGNTYATIFLWSKEQKR